MRNEVSSSNPMPPENVAIAIGCPLNKFLKSSPEIDNQAMKFERIGGIDHYIQEHKSPTFLL